MRGDGFPARQAFRDALAQVFGVPAERVDPKMLSHLAWDLVSHRRGDTVPSEAIITAVSRWLALPAPHELDGDACQKLQQHLELYLEELDAAVARLRPST